MDFSKLKKPITGEAAVALQDPSLVPEVRSAIAQTFVAEGVKIPKALQLAELGSGYFQYRRGTEPRERFETGFSNLEQGLFESYFGLGQNQFNLLVERAFGMVDKFIETKIGIQLN